MKWFELQELNIIIGDFSVPLKMGTEFLNKGGVKAIRDNKITSYTKERKTLQWDKLLNKDRVHCRKSK